MHPVPGGDGEGGRRSWTAPRGTSRLLESLGDAMADASICGLGQAAPNSVRCAYRYFREELS